MLSKMLFLSFMLSSLPALANDEYSCHSKDEMGRLLKMVITPHYLKLFFDPGSSPDPIANQFSLSKGVTQRNNLTTYSKEFRDGTQITTQAVTVPADAYRKTFFTLSFKTTFKADGYNTRYYVNEYTCSLLSP